MKEQELKYAIPSLADYELLCCKLSGFQNEIIQTNIYYDTENAALLQQHIMVRLRLFNYCAQLTIKYNPQHHNGYFQAEQWEVDVEREEAEVFEHSGAFSPERLGSMPKEIQTFVQPTLIEVGRTVNKRRIYHVGDLVLELDFLTINDQITDYELEIETECPDAAKQYVAKICENHHIALKNQPHTKYERLLLHSAKKHL